MLPPPTIVPNDIQLMNIQLLICVLFVEPVQLNTVEPALLLVIVISVMDISWFALSTNIFDIPV